MLRRDIAHVQTNDFPLSIDPMKFKSGGVGGVNMARVYKSLCMRAGIHWHQSAGVSGVGTRARIRNGFACVPAFADTHARGRKKKGTGLRGDGPRRRYGRCGGASIVAIGSEPLARE